MRPALLLPPRALASARSRWSGGPARRGSPTHRLDGLHEGADVGLKTGLGRLPELATHGRAAGPAAAAASARRDDVLDINLRSSGDQLVLHRPPKDRIRVFLSRRGGGTAPAVRSSVSPKRRLDRARGGARVRDWTTRTRRTRLSARSRPGFRSGPAGRWARGPVPTHPGRQTATQ